MRRTRTGTRERLTAACDTLIAVAAVLIIAARALALGPGEANIHGPVLDGDGT